MATYTTSLANLDTLLQGLDTNTPETAYDIEVTGLTANDCGSALTNGTLGYILSQHNNEEKYIDLSPTILPNDLTSMERTFHTCTKLVYMPNIPSTVTNLSQVMANCSSLRAIPNIPDAVTNMGEAFTNGYNVKYIGRIGNGATNMYSAFLWCSKVEYIIWDRTDFTGLSAYHAFNIANLKCIYVPSAAAKASLIASVSSGAFPSGFDVNTQIQEMYTVADITELNTLLQSLPDNTTDMPYHITLTTLASSEAQGNSKGTLSDTLQYVLKQNPTKYISLDIKNNIGSYTMQYMCYNCTSLVGISFSGTTNFSTTSYSHYAFQNCTNLKRVDLSNVINMISGSFIFYNIAITSIGNTHDYDMVINRNAVDLQDIWYCNNLETIILNNNISNSQSGWFTIQNCQKLSTLILPSATRMPTVTGPSALTDLPVVPHTKIIYLVVEGSLISGNITAQRLKTAYPEASHISKLKLDNCNIEQVNFDISDFMYYTSTHTQPTKGDLSASAVGELQVSFKNCTSLASASFPNLVYIGQLYKAFEGCTALESVTFPDLEYVCDYYSDSVQGACNGGMMNTFKGCTSLTTINIQKLKYVLSSSSTDAGPLYGMFDGCTSLTSIDLSHLLYISDTTYSTYGGDQSSRGIFKNCTSLVSATFNENMQFKAVYTNKADNSYCIMFSPYIFYGCTSLTTITGFPKLCKDYAYSFYNCTSLRSFDFSLYTDKSISLSRTFNNCTALTNLTFNNKTEIITMPMSYDVYSAFSGCTSLSNDTKKEILRRVIIHTPYMFTAQREAINYPVTCVPFNLMYYDYTSRGNSSYSEKNVCLYGNNASPGEDTIIDFNMASGALPVILNSNKKKLIIQHLDSNITAYNRLITLATTSEFIILSTDIDPDRLIYKGTNSGSRTPTLGPKPLQKVVIYVDTVEQRTKWIAALQQQNGIFSGSYTQEEAEQIVKVRQSAALSNKYFCNLRIGNNKINVLQCGTVHPIWTKADYDVSLQYSTTYDLCNIVFENTKMCTYNNYINNKYAYERINGKAIGIIANISDSVPRMLALNPPYDPTEFNLSASSSANVISTTQYKYKICKDDTVAGYNMPYTKASGYDLYDDLCAYDPTGTATAADLAENYPLINVARTFRNDKQYYNKDWYLPAYDEIDPSAYLCATYFIFYGLSVVKYNQNYNVIYAAYATTSNNTAPANNILQQGFECFGDRSLTSRYSSSKLHEFIPLLLMHRVGPEYDGSQQIGSLK